MFRVLSVSFSSFPDTHTRSSSSLHEIDLSNTPWSFSIGLKTEALSQACQDCFEFGEAEMKLI